MSEFTGIDVILEPGGIRILYQPVFDFSGDHPIVHGFEALTRGPRGTNFETADVLFEYVRRKREEARVDRACMAAALQDSRRLPGTSRIAINVHASTLANDRQFTAFVEEAARSAGISTLRLTIEIVEHSPAWDDRKFHESLDRLRDFGIRIALDDVGLGQSNYKMMIDANPDYLKIDRYFANRCAKDPSRRAVIESIRDLALHFNAATVAEGVEEPEDFSVLLSSGIMMIQGYLLSRPLPVDDLAPDAAFWSRVPAAAAELLRRVRSSEGSAVESAAKPIAG
jgi:EAL domain-containing protein (putative c-di-GMP-specific phosphodiesterase class I)